MNTKTGLESNPSPLKDAPKEHAAITACSGKLRAIIGPSNREDRAVLWFIKRMRPPGLVAEAQGIEGADSKQRTVGRPFDGSNWVVVC